MRSILNGGKSPVRENAGSGGCSGSGFLGIEVGGGVAGRFGVWVTLIAIVGETERLSRRLLLLVMLVLVLPSGIIDFAVAFVGKKNSASGKIKVKILPG